MRLRRSIVRTIRQRSHDVDLAADVSVEVVANIGEAPSPSPTRMRDGAHSDDSETLREGERDE